MDVLTLHKANELNKEIIRLTQALRCFVWPDSNGASRNPIIIIEYDDYDGRETERLNFDLSDGLIQLIKNEIKTELDRLVKEFNEL